jgi:hypothetical protein
MAVTSATLAPTMTAEVAEKVIAHYSPRAVHRRRSIVEFVTAIAMALACGLLFWGSGFARNMVHDQLSDQKISFPATAASLPKATAPQLTQYVGQTVSSGPSAKAYANLYIGEHLKATNGGKTYSQTSADFMAANTKLGTMKSTDAGYAAQQATVADLGAKRQTLFMGETLRGLLLYAWGWWLVGQIAFYVAFVALAGAVVLLGLAVFGVFQYRRDPALKS